MKEKPEAEFVEKFFWQKRNQSKGRDSSIKEEGASVIESLEKSRLWVQLLFCSS